MMENSILNIMALGLLKFCYQQGKQMSRSFRAFTAKVKEYLSLMKKTFGSSLLNVTFKLEVHCFYSPQGSASG